jgi:hypothetical protein
MGVANRFFLITALVMAAALAQAGDMLIDDFSTNPQLRWAYLSDQVMGGVSEGSVEYRKQEGESFAHLTGRVSTENNGGFIQVRTRINKGTTGTVAGVYLKVRGNSQGYYIHLRTAGTMLPWQYYQASFDTTEEWQTIRLPLSAFERSGNWLRSKVKASSIRSLGVVAYGRDHQAEIDVAEIGFYD